MQASLSVSRRLSIPRSVALLELLPTSVQSIELALRLVALGRDGADRGGIVVERGVAEALVDRGQRRLGGVDSGRQSVELGALSAR